ncbi:AAA domain-containing protein [Actinoplanes sp. NBRC 103695]|uniref:DEAD/DEAH box helicase n=1 Tax=Actinoplanes sp. NBRC 103695 TaxID=3032202 RepID=UPI0024A5CB7C|nr:AAA domain-containing protein [Actinoplanes sp. NBRC 103695]GLZ01950.1 hypothetical protein Acsp02_92010 [Actinoplanes sp. NBRC 103695]
MAGIEVVAASRPIVFVAGRNFLGKFHEQLRAYPFLPQPEALPHELGRLSAAGGVAVTVDDGKGWIRLYVQRCCIAVRPTNFQDAYSIEFMEPMRLANHGRLARSWLRLTAPYWSFVYQLHQVPQGSIVPDQEIRQAWQRTRTDRVVHRLPARHEQFCDALGTVIETGRRIEAERDPGGRILPYYKVRSTAQQRRSAAGGYEFLLSRPSSVKAGDMVHLRAEPDLRGRVTAIDGERLTVGFEGAIDRQRIAERGELMISGNDVIARVQGDAVAKLRSGTTLHQRLLPLLVDGGFTPPEPVTAQPAESLDEAQTEAFRRALGVPDLLCVVGPPGTGKTRTIVEIARAAAARGERVLIASQTNTAVDNVIERMPAVLTALRAGNEERFSAAMADKTLAATAVHLQERVLARTQATAQRLEPWAGEPSLALRWIQRLEALLATVRQAELARDDARARLAAARLVVEQRFAGPMQASGDTRRQTAAAAQTACEAEDWLTERVRRADLRAAGMLGFLSAWWARRLRPRLLEATTAAAQTRAQADRAAQEDEAWRTRLHQETESDAQVRRATELVGDADSTVAREFGAAQETARRTARLFAGVEGVLEPGSNAASLGAFAEWCLAWEPFLRQRTVLLAEWRAQLSRPTEQLHPELIRYADVIGATCIGVGVQRNLLADLDFDLAVIDEAGQIPLASTLVPLVRARRIVLVGDHHQLPPFVDDDVRRALGGPAQAGLAAELLVHSAFEMLADKAGKDNLILLNRQRRMPAVLAEFVSAEFYGGKLLTEDQPRQPLAFFTSALVVVDTSTLPADDRAERQRQKTESWLAAGCDNKEEARIVLDLVQAYARAGRDWVVIAPYRAQVQLIDMWIREALGNDAVRDRVGTVDAFQGQERDIVIFSFTRSNPHGRVGFLSELRRLNVAVTRARDQLVLVGDRSTLVRARHEGFQGLAQRLYRYADRNGDVLTPAEMKSRLS